jgi:hypothetical protein
MPPQRDQTPLPAWLTTQLMDAWQQTLHRQGINPQEVPYGWRAMQALEERVRQHTAAFAGDFMVALQTMQTYRQQYSPHRGTPQEDTP